MVKNCFKKWATVPILLFMEIMAFVYVKYDLNYRTYIGASLIAKKYNECPLSVTK